MLDFGFCWLRRTSMIQWRMHKSHEAHRETNTPAPLCLFVTFDCQCTQTDWLQLLLTVMLSTLAVPGNKLVYSVNQEFTRWRKTHTYMGICNDCSKHQGNYTHVTLQAVIEQACICSPTQTKSCAYLEGFSNPDQESAQAHCCASPQQFPTWAQLEAA